VVADYVPALQKTIDVAAASFPAGEKALPVQAILMQSYNHAVATGAASAEPSYLASNPTVLTGDVVVSSVPSGAGEVAANSASGAASAETKNGPTQRKSLLTIQPAKITTISNSVSTPYGARHYAMP
jgi:hypothetical protein